MIMKMYPEKRKTKQTLKKAAPKTAEAPFFDAVYAVVRRVPRGRVTTYGAVAEATGMRMSARMVGWALSVCSKARPVVPAHRVVNRLGILSGRHHFATPTLMQELLEQEGIQVDDDTVVDFKNLLWKPGDRK